MIRRDYHERIFKISAQFFHFVVYKAYLLPDSFVRRSIVVHIVVGLIPVGINIFFTVFFTKFAHYVTSVLHGFRLYSAVF